MHCSKFEFSEPLISMIHSQFLLKKINFSGSIFRISLKVNFGIRNIRRKLNPNCYSYSHIIDHMVEFNPSLPLLTEQWGISI